MPIINNLTYPGPAWFYHELIPAAESMPAAAPILDHRMVAAIWQLANSYMLLGLLQSFGFRAIRDTLANNPAAQERILGASMTALAFADITHVVITLMAAPKDVRFAFTKWNAMSHGNTTFVLLLCAARLAWFAGIGRTRFYFGQQNVKKAV